MNLKAVKIWKIVTPDLKITVKRSGQKGKQHGLSEIPNTKEIIKMVDKLSDEILLSEAQKSEILELYKKHFYKGQNTKIRKFNEANKDNPDPQEKILLCTVS